jgi:probable F420-dependent oxidoreductase
VSIHLGTYGVWKPLRAADPRMAGEIEAMGYGALWIGGSPPGDLEAIEDIIEATKRIPIVTGIVNMWREEAPTVGASYRRIAERHPDRFLLGVGVGHPESTTEYQSPVRKINDYLDQLVEAGVPNDRMVLAALGPRVLKIAAERTAGAHPYLTTPRHTRMARDVTGAETLLAPEQKIILEIDPDRARAEARMTVDRYLRLVNYRNNLLREKWSESDLEDAGSDALVDELVLHGDTRSVADGIRRHIDAGADHVCIQALGTDPIAEYRDLAEFLLGQT